MTRERRMSQDWHDQIDNELGFLRHRLRYYMTRIESSALHTWRTFFLQLADDMRVELERREHQ